MDNTQSQPPVVRRAAAADVAALTRLREVRLSDMGMLATGADPGWRDKAETRFAYSKSDWRSPLRTELIANRCRITSSAAEISETRLPFTKSLAMLADT